MSKSNLSVSSLHGISSRVLLVGLALATGSLAQVDTREIIRRTVAADERNWQTARNYEFSERVDARKLDSQGRVKSQDVTLYDVMLLVGSPYRKITGRDDRPLPLSDEKKEQAKLARSIDERRRETSGQRAARLAEYVARPDWQREAWGALPEAFDFRISGRQLQDGRNLYVMDAIPRVGYRPRSRTSEVFAHLKGRLWVDADDYRLVKAHVEVVKTISVGLILFRLAQGSHAEFEQTQVDVGVWLPRRVQVFGSARIGMFKMWNIQQEIIYSNHRESRTYGLTASGGAAPARSRTFYLVSSLSCRTAVSRNGSREAIAARRSTKGQVLKRDCKVSRQSPLLSECNPGDGLQKSSCGCGCLQRQTEGRWPASIKRGARWRMGSRIK